MNYEATREPDGSLVIKDVPIFLEAVRDDFEVTPAWLTEAVATAKQLEAEGYLPPLHVYHHGSSDYVMRAGSFKVTGLRRMTYRGEPKLAIFADLIVTDEGVQMGVLMERLPYRSVEICDTEVPEINSLALLDHEAPYFTLPMLHVRNAGQLAAEADFSPENFANPWLDGTRKDGDALVAFKSEGQRAVCFMQDEPNMTKTKTKTAAADAASAAEQIANGTPGQAFEAGTDDREEMAADGDEDGEEMEAGGPDVGAIVGMIEDGTIAVGDLDLIEAAVAARRAGAEVDAEGVEDDMPAPAGQVMQASIDVARQLAFQSGKIQALEARDRARDAKEVRAADVAAAMKRLGGRPMGANLEARLFQHHENHGRASFAAFVDGLDAVAPTPGVMIDDEAGLAAFSGQPTEELPAEVMAYTDQGTEAVRKAAVFSRQYDELKRRGVGMRAGREAFIRSNMAAS